MPPQTTEKPKRERKRAPSVRITEETEAKLTKFGEQVAAQISAGPYKLPAPSPGDLVGILLDSALESKNGTGS